MVKNASAMLAVGVLAEGYREILNMAVFTWKNETDWKKFVRGLVASGFIGFEMVTSEAHPLKSSISHILSGSSRNQCYYHFTQNVLDKGPKKALWKLQNGDQPCRSGCGPEAVQPGGGHIRLFKPAEILDDARKAGIRAYAPSLRAPAHKLYDKSDGEPKLSYHAVMQSCWDLPEQVFHRAFGGKTAVGAAGGQAGGKEAHKHRPVRDA